MKGILVGFGLLAALVVQAAIERHIYEKRVLLQRFQRYAETMGDLNLAYVALASAADRAADAFRKVLAEAIRRSGGEA